MTTNSQRNISIRMRSIKNYLATKAQFRTNNVTGKLEFKSEAMLYFKDVDDYVLNTMSVELAEKGIRCSPNELRDILMSRVSPRFNPFTDFLRELPKWDGTTDFIEELADSVKTTNQAFWKKAFKKWLVALVGSISQDKIINHTVLVLIGEQGVGKSTWLMNLVPGPLSEYAYAGQVRLDNKDTLIMLSEKMVIILEELAYLNKRQLNELKEIITKTDVQLRRAYGRFTESMPRRASFAGSVNDKEFLTDTTGSRRFLCFDVVHIEKPKVDLMMVYAQAVALFKSGFQYWFDLDEITEVNTNNEQYRIKPIEEELLLLTYEPAFKGQICQRLTAAEIQKMINQDHNLPLSDASLQRIGKALTKNKFQFTKSGGKKLYMVKYRDQEKGGYLSQVSEFDNKLDFK